MMSVEGEVVPLKKRIKPSEAGGAVEKWLVQVGLCSVSGPAGYTSEMAQRLCASTLGRSFSGD